MGLGIFGCIVELKLRILEQNLSKFQQYIKFWVRYVDDVFCVIHSGQKPEELLQELNNLKPNIQFTLETETDNRINFLDVKLIKRTNTILITVHRKSTNNNKIIHNNCKNPNNYKIAALRNYINVAILIYSNDSLLKEEINFIEKIAINAVYNKNLIRNLYRRRLKEIIHKRKAQKPKKNFTSAIPYAQGISQRIQREAAKMGVSIPY